MKRFRIIVRPRFTLWAMLVLITVVAIPLGYVARRRMTTARVVEQSTKRPSV